MSNKNEKLNTALYDKLFDEQTEYEQWILTLSPKEILDHSYEYTVRNDIVLALEYHDLTDEQCKALLKLDKPLEAIFRTHENRETGYMSQVFDSVAFCANDLLGKEIEDDLFGI